MRVRGWARGDVAALPLPGDGVDAALTGTAMFFRPDEQPACTSCAALRTAGFADVAVRRNGGRAAIALGRRAG